MNFSSNSYLDLNTNLKWRANPFKVLKILFFLIFSTVYTSGIVVYVCVLVSVCVFLCAFVCARSLCVYKSLQGGKLFFK